MAKKLTRFYTANFERRPVITLCVTNSLLSTIGDAAAQLIPIIVTAHGAPVPSWDIDRTLRFAMFGFSIGPMIEKWNRFLEYRFPLRPVAEVFEGPTHEDPNSPAFIEKLKRDAEKEGFKTVAMPNTGQPGQISIYALFQRVFADQLFMAPIGLAIFISTMAILEGLEWDEIVERYKRLYLPILLVNWQIWPFVQIINFRYLPLRYRVPFSASLGVLW
ncbi:hypothetical protein P389DRAFT_139857 [Cystobasidium minutum MCA 4210]|uniref:uncharacterized protein n=1 Tax=Cystobasidium minutum MCA 4210 TaxID=1397322 RepID=UPI0034CD64DE|eukprot:jgi/Rhomi1/139857/e_gw1.1.775.1